MLRCYQAEGSVRSEVVYSTGWTEPGRQTPISWFVLHSLLSVVYQLVNQSINQSILLSGKVAHKQSKQVVKMCVCLDGLLWWCTVIQLQLWPVPNYTVWWQRHMCVNNLPRVNPWARIVSLKPWPLHHRATWKDILLVKFLQKKFRALSQSFCSYVVETWHVTPPGTSKIDSCNKICVVCWKSFQ